MMSGVGHFAIAVGLWAASFGVQAGTVNLAFEGVVDADDGLGVSGEMMRLDMRYATPRREPLQAMRFSSRVSSMRCDYRRQ